MIFRQRVNCTILTLFLFCPGSTVIAQQPFSNKAKLVWSDEFNYTGLPNSTKWIYDVGGHGFGNNEKQYYLERSIENTFVSNGKLHIVALKKNHKELF